MGLVLKGIAPSATDKKGKNKVASLSDDVVVCANGKKALSFTVAMRTRIWEQVANGDAEEYGCQSYSAEVMGEYGVDHGVIAIFAVTPGSGNAARAYGAKRGEDRADAPYRSARILKTSAVAEDFEGWPEHGFRTATWDIGEVETEQGVRKALLLTGWVK